MTTWEEFAGMLRHDLDLIDEGDTVVMRAGSGRIVQFTYRCGQLRLEVVGNHFLPADHQLDATELARLTEIGWHDPLRPRDGNHWMDLHGPRTTSRHDELVTQILSTMRDVLAIESPDRLDVSTWNDNVSPDPLPHFMLTRLRS